MKQANDFAYNMLDLDTDKEKAVYCAGRDMIVAPLMNDEGTRDIYLPEGGWVDFFTGESFCGPTWLRRVQYPLDGFEKNYELYY